MSSRNWRGLLASIGALSTVSSPAWSQQESALAKGVAAYERHDYLDAFAVLKPLSAAGEPKATELLAEMFSDGSGVPANPEEAARLRSQAATQRTLFGALPDPWEPRDNSAADGLRAFDSKDYLEAFSQLKPAADRGDATAQIRLGDLFANGLGVPQNNPEAARLYASAMTGTLPASPLHRVASERLKALDAPLPPRPELASTPPYAQPDGATAVSKPAKSRIPWGKIALGALIVVGVAALAVAASKGGGGGYGAPADYQWRWDGFRGAYGNMEWRCRGVETGQFADSYHCAGQPQIDNTWPGQ